MIVYLLCFSLIKLLCWGPTMCSGYKEPERIIKPNLKSLLANGRIKFECTKLQYVMWKSPLQMSIPKGELMKTKWSRARAS